MSSFQSLALPTSFLQLRNFVTLCTSAGQREAQHGNVASSYYYRYHRNQLKSITRPVNKRGMDPRPSTEYGVRSRGGHAFRAAPVASGRVPSTWFGAPQLHQIRHSRARGGCSGSFMTAFPDPRSFALFNYNCIHVEGQKKKKRREETEYLWKGR